MTTQEIKVEIEDAFQNKTELSVKLQQAMSLFFTRLENGEIRSAKPTDSGWRVNTWVKKGILLAFRLGQLHDYSINEHLVFFDKHNIPPQKFTLRDGIRIVPGGTTVRSGSFVAKGVVIMPPAYINIGAYVDEGTMVDSHVLVGSCAQIGKNVHLSAAAQIGGVLEPIGAMPVIVEDNVVVGGMVGVFEGTIVRKNAVLGAGVMLTRSTPVYDCVHEKVHRAEGETPLIIPAGAVVIPGSRPLNMAFGRLHHLSVQTPLIVKYRDRNTDAATALEDALR